MGWKTRPLIRLEHVVRPTESRREIEIGIQNTGSVTHEAEGGVLWTRRRAGDFCGAVHSAGSRVRIGIAHSDECRMSVAHIVFACKSKGDRLRCPGGRGFVEPVSRLYVVLRSSRQRAAAGRASVRSGAEPLEKIIRSAIFLDN